jgi:SPASM domain peptide maturase of grasp-with-spasm system
MKHVKLFANCIPVKGYNQSFIYDLQRPKASNAIPNDLYEILTKHADKSLYEIKHHYGHVFDEEIDEYFKFLQDEGFAYNFQEKELPHFSALENIWDSPSKITNAIIYVKKHIAYLQNIFKELSSLRCDALQICFTSIPTIEQIRNIGEMLETLRILSVELLMNSNDIEYNRHIIAEFNQYTRFQRLYIGNSSENLSSENGRIITNSDAIDFQNGCGKISSLYFALNINVFFESQAHNTCLNRKLCIDAEGNIKNCPAMQQSFGNIRDTTLQEAIEKPGFKDLWYIHKDQIDVCKDCGFRHMCTDCRCFIKDPENIYSQPAKCTYNPYICKWQGQESYIPIEECGMYSKETGFVPNHEKIRELNEMIWNETE